MQSYALGRTIQETELTMWKYLRAWIPMVLIAVANGALREGWYGKHLGELQAHQVFTVSGILLFSVYIWHMGYGVRLRY